MTKRRLSSCPWVAIGVLSPVLLMAQPVITRGPYLQLGGERTMTIVWNTDVVTDGVVQFGETSALGVEVADVVGESQVHVVTLEGLAAGTEYHYRVSSDGEVLAGGLTFRTFPPSGCGSPFRLAAWGDSGTGDANQFAEAASIQSLLPDLAVHTGDLIYPFGEAENYNPHYFEPYKDIIARINLYNSLGNHDYLTDRAQPYLDALYLPSNNPQQTERYYSFDYANVHFVAVDTNQNFAPESAQHDWLGVDLAATDADWKVVFHHHTPYTVGVSHARDLINVKIREHLGALYDLHHVDFVLLGHTHGYERSFPIREATVATLDEGPDYVEPPGTIYITTGGGGRFLNSHNTEHPNNEFQVVFIRQLHATLFDFDGLRVTATAVNVDGETIDTFTIAKSSSAVEIDCNDNGRRDACDLLAGTSGDCNNNGVPDECETDCNENGRPDACDIADGTSRDCNANGTPDACDLATSVSLDCNANDTPDACDLGTELGTDVNDNGVPDSCEVDCNDNAIPDSFELAQDGRDSNQNGLLDDCETPVVVGLGQTPESFILDGGERAIGMVLRLNVPSGAEDIVVSDAQFENVGEGRLGELVEKAELFGDSNDNGVFDSADVRIGLANAELFAKERVVFGALDARLSSGREARAFLVLDVKLTQPVTSGLVPLNGLLRWFLLALWVAVAGVGLLRFGWPRGRLTAHGHRGYLTASALVALGVCITAPGCGGGGGGGPPAPPDPQPAGSRQLQLRLDAFEVRTADSDTPLLHEGVPLLGEPFDLP